MNLPIDSRGDHGTVLQGQLAKRSVAVEDGTASLAAQIEHGQVASSLSVDVAVHAVVARVPPVGDVTGLETFQIPFLDLQVVPYFEAGFDEPVRQIGIDPVRADMDGPLPGYGAIGTSVGRDNRDVGTCSSFHQACPLLFFPDDFPSPQRYGQAASGENGRETGTVRIGIVEIERCDIAGNGDVGVVREQGRRTVGTRSCRTHIKAPSAREQKEGRQKEPCKPDQIIPFHS